METNQLAGTSHRSERSIGPPPAQGTGFAREVKLIYDNVAQFQPRWGAQLGSTAKGANMQ